MLPPTVVGGLDLLRERREWRTPYILKNLWKEWELPSLVLLSLTIQVVLAALGNRRKYNHKVWIRAVIWLAYLVADSTATLALAVLSYEIAEMLEEMFALESRLLLTREMQISSFWAPFLLLHLGGPDTITAYALEDNELWLRHLLGLFVRTGVALSISFRAWTAGSHYLSIPSMLMTLAGLIKYGERIWVLRSSSNDQLRRSLPTRRTGADVYLQMVEEKQFVRKRSGRVEEAAEKEECISEEDALVLGMALSKLIRCLFVEGLLSSEDQDLSNAIFKDFYSDSAYKVIEIELGLMYDTIYTKASLFYTRCGIGLRIISFSVTCVSLVLFSVGYHRLYTYGDFIFGSFGNLHTKVYFFITLLLLGVAIIVEIYTALLQLCSDQTIAWLITKNKYSTSRAMASFLLSKTPRHRWSNVMPQYNLLSHFLREKPLRCRRVMSLIGIEDKLEKQIYIVYKQIPDDLKKWIFDSFRKVCMDDNVKESCNLSMSRGSFSLNLFSDQYDALRWSTTDMQFEQSVIVWHIATEICYYVDCDNFAFLTSVSERDELLVDISEAWKLSKLISRYMMFLLALKPEMFTSVRAINLQDTCVEGHQFLSTNSETQKAAANKRQKRTQACIKLFDYKHSESSHAPENSLLKHACHLARQLSKPNMDALENVARSNEELVNCLRLKWNTVTGVWLELLAYAAIKCKQSQHMQQLKRGGELLTHIWLLLAHFDLINDMRPPQPPI